MRGLTKDMTRSLFNLAGIEILAMWELVNQYWPRPQFEPGREHESLEYAKLRQESPWWLVKTPYGMIQIGTRKRVIEIRWGDTGLSAPNITDDKVTKDEHLVHAWSEVDAAKYLHELGKRLLARNSQHIA